MSSALRLLLRRHPTRRHRNLQILSESSTDPIRLHVEEAPPKRKTAKLSMVESAHPLDQPELPPVPAAPVAAPPPKVVDDKAAGYAAMDAAFRAVAQVLAPKAMIALALLGAFILAMFAMFRGWVGLTTLIAYGLLTVVPLAIVEWRKAQ